MNTDFAERVLRQIQLWEQQAVENGGLGLEVISVGPFRALIDRQSDFVWQNMVIPVGPLPDDLTPLIEALRDHFRSRRRTLRFEFNEGLYPALASQLEQLGFDLQLRQPLMAGTPAGFHPRTAAGVTTRVLTPSDPDSMLDAFLTIRRTGFGEPELRSTPEQIAGLRTALAGKNRYGLAEIDSVPAATAVLNPLAGVAEMVGVATLPRFRRRGVAATLCSRLIREHFANGGTLVWLDAADSLAQALYETLGFQLVGSRLNYIAR